MPSPTTEQRIAIIADFNSEKIKAIKELMEEELMELVMFMYASCAETVPNTRPALWNIDINTKVTFEGLIEAYQRSKH